MGYTEEQFQKISSGITDPVNKTKDTSSTGFTEEQAAAIENAGINAMGGSTEYLDLDHTKYDATIKAQGFNNDLYRAQDQSWGTQLY